MAEATDVRGARSRIAARLVGFPSVELHLLPHRQVRA